MEPRGAGGLGARVRVAGDRGASEGRPVPSDAKPRIACLTELGVMI